MRLFKMKHCLSICLILFIGTQIIAQHRIEFDIQNYDNDTLVIGYYLLDKQLVQDTLITEEKPFVLEGEENLQSGTYMLLTLPDQNFTQFLVNPNEQNFTVKFDKENRDKVEYINSPDNQAFQDYVDFLMVKRPAAEVFRDTIDALSKKGEDFSLFQNLLTVIDKEVKDKQDALIAANPDFISSQMIKANKEIILPNFDDADNPSQAKFEYYKEHYFDNIAIDKDGALRSPYLYQRVNYYIEKLTMNHPDSMILSIDYILDRMSPQPETFKFYLSHLLNKYANSKVVGFDGLYVHLVDKYYAKGKADWVEQEQLDKIVNNANKIRPTLIGKTGADIEVYLEDGTPLKISDIDYEYLVILFWAPDCGHCKKSMPDFVAFNEKWNPRGVKTLAVCSKLGEKEADCWDMLEDKNMLGFINATDKFHKSRFKVKYNVTKTPKVFVLDKNREILIKDIGGDQLDSVLEEIIKIEQAGGTE